MLTAKSHVKLSSPEVPPQSCFGMIHDAAIGSCLLA
jgi:hypothetical protein